MPPCHRPAPRCRVPLRGGVDKEAPHDAVLLSSFPLSSPAPCFPGKPETLNRATRPLPSRQRPPPKSPPSCTSPSSVFLPIRSTSSPSSFPCKGLVRGALVHRRHPRYLFPVRRRRHAHHRLQPFELKMVPSGAPPPPPLRSDAEPEQELPSSSSSSSTTFVGNTPRSSSSTPSPHRSGPPPPSPSMNLSPW